MPEQLHFTQRDWQEFHQRAQTGPCFICEIIANNPEYPHYPVYKDDIAIAFLDKYPTLFGRTLVAPLQHREQVTGDFSIQEYLALQRRVYLIAEAIRQELNAERIYLMTFGSQQGNSHVHWHIAPLPPGVPYEKQQLHAVSGIDGILKMTENEWDELASRIRNRIIQLDGIQNENSSNRQDRA
jgi:diadenosine tetraphosphate (Ap4A) HIT family hydrolase